MATLVGRDAELRSIEQATAAAEVAGRWAVVIDGEAGIGKTSLWRAAIDQLATDSFVLTVRSTEAEAPLAFVGLTDLLATVPDTAIAALPAPQRVALEAATLRAPADPDRSDPRAISTGLSTLLDELGRTRPVVVAVDDVQWLDAASLGAIEFALRRTVAGLLVSRRGTGDLVPLASSIGVSVHRVTLGPLTLGALHHVLREELGHPLRRPDLVRVATAAAGNPLFASELARALERRGRAGELGAPLPVPDTLRELTTGRIEATGAEARRTILVTALSSRPTVELLRTVGADAGIDEAERAGIVAVVRGRVELVHPLLASAAVEVAPAPERRAAHAALAAATDDDELKARHLALAATEPSSEVALALDRAVGSTQARGATVSAAELARLALEHTVDPTSRDAMRRTAVLAGLTFEAGDAAESERLLRLVLEGSDEPPVRAAAALELADILYERGLLADCVAFALQAVDDAAGNPSLSAKAHLTTAALGHEPEQHGAAAAAIVEATTDVDPLIRAWARFQAVTNRFAAGDGLDLEALDDALDAERQGRAWRSDDHVANSWAALLKFADHLDLARAALDELRARAEEEGNDGQLPYIVGHYPFLFLRTGDFARAADVALEHLELAEATGQSNQVWQAHFNLAVVALHAGQLDAALSAIGRMEALIPDGDPGPWRSLAGVRGSIRLQQGDVDAALRDLDRWWELTQELSGEPGSSRFHADYAEALIAGRRLADCAAFLDEAERRATRAGRVSVLAVVARSRAVLAAAGGDLSGALAAIDVAVGLDDELPLPVERARTLLVKGQLHRRAKEKRLARDALTLALEGFEAAGATGWADRCRTELSRVNIRPAAPLELTATERRVAELAASGLTNREIAAAAFVSAKTVEANLARVYRKLGIGSRAELGRRMAQERAE